MGSSPIRTAKKRVANAALFFVVRSTFFYFATRKRFISFRLAALRVRSHPPGSPRYDCDGKGADPNPSLQVFEAELKEDGVVVVLGLDGIQDLLTEFGQRDGTVFLNTLELIDIGCSVYSSQGGGVFQSGNRKL